MGFRRGYFLRLGSGGVLVKLALRLGSLFAGLEHQSGSVWFARMALRRALFGGGDSFVAGLTLACFAHLVGCAQDDGS
jgi:hypothetical protein